jgi:tRNA dimethylallyltransferase
MDGECDLDEAVRRGVVATRRYAKRQLTWLRSEPEVTWFDSGTSRLVDEACAVVARGLAATDL